MKIYLKISIIIAILTATFSCEQQVFVFNVNCDECYYPEPDSANLIMSFTINEENAFVPYILYIGDIEDNKIDYIDTAYTEKLELYSKVDEYYSVKAFYKKGTQTIVVVDGDKLKTSRTTDVCDYECWIIKGGILDMTLKNE
ncbi:MAG: hypothetical protein K9H49_12885 [Bacteroidales bacterium]|nr:hypothetical protein [Bacteroidales bacterium]MCF8390416.1 hypothetical protein [Bacteroidales bacterium]